MRFLLAFFLFTAPAFAQLDSGTIVGNVHDQSGAAVASASVTITSNDTNAQYKVETDGNGDYVSPPLRVGAYSIRVEASGFKSETKEKVTLQVQDRIRYDFSMVIGAVTDNVTVSAEDVQLIQSETSSLGQVVSSREITELPLNGRDYVQLASLTTGVVRTNTGTNGNIGGSSTGGQNSFVANGARGTLNNFLLDGVDNNSNDNGGFVLRTSVDAIEEFKIQTNSFSSEFGRSGGAAINAVIKSGTNSYHGSLFEFFRNSALDARDFFEDPTQKKASFKQNQFGGTFGGPILKNKLFWFGDYQRTSISNPFTYISSVPTADIRSGDFSAAGNNTIYDPETGNPFPGNVIPSGSIDAIAQAMLNLYPLPNRPGAKNNYIISPSGTDDIDQGDARVDYNFSSNDQIFGRLSMSRRDTFTPTPFPTLANGGGGNTGLGTEDAKGAAVGYTHTFSPTVINVFRAGFTYVHVKRGVPPGGNNLPPDDIRVPGVPDNPATNGITLFRPSGYTREGDPGFAPTILASQERQVGDVLNWTRGSHSFKFGAEMRWSQFNIFQVADPNGTFNFTGQFTSNADDEDSGNPIADELLGLPLSSSISTLLNLGNRQHVPSFFAQDDYKVNKHLTLNLGVRYEYFSPLVEVHDKQSNFDYSTGAIIVAGQNSASRGLVEADKANFAPRIGFAWSPFDNDKTVVRGAYGIFYSGQEIRTAAPLQLAYNVPFFSRPSFISDGITPILTVSGGFPAVDPAAAIDPPVTSVDQHLKTPYFQQWNLAVQRALPGQMSLEVAYAGSKGTHLQVVTDQNQVVDPGPGDVQSRRPFPDFGSFTSIQNRGNSTYHSLQLKLQKRFSSGLSFLSAYTVGKAINDLPEICCAAPFPQNSYDLRAEKGLADFDERQRWVTSFDYELPIGRGRRHNIENRALNLVAGGWHVGGILTLASGFPFSPWLGFDPSNTGDQGLVRANRTGNGNLPSGQRTPDLWFDINAFTIPDDFTYGNSGRNVLIGPGQKIFDGSIRKVFSLTERQKLEFRTEFFNMLNHPNFSQPDNFIDDGPGAAGTITSLAVPQRQIQFGLKYSF
ncbi:MAG TPA: TonB-dependent receptor [Candidatus Saccharimonadales bacterium]|nr:TonB-dependent receptor [Candidatus Saccharimonadales bacterium]